nr:hypothetical protein [Microvirga tunisiensis]
MSLGSCCGEPTNAFVDQLRSTAAIALFEFYLAKPKLKLGFNMPSLSGHPEQMRDLFLGQNSLVVRVEVKVLHDLKGRLRVPLLSRFAVPPQRFFTVSLNEQAASPQGTEAELGLLVTEFCRLAEKWLDHHEPVFDLADLRRHFLIVITRPNRRQGNEIEVAADLHRVLVENCPRRPTHHYACVLLPRTSTFRPKCWQ